MVLVAAARDRSLVLLNSEALVRGKDSILALEQSPQYSPAYALMLNKDAADPQAEEDTSMLPESSADDDTQKPLDEACLPFEIRAALEDAILLLRQQAEYLASKSRSMQRRLAERQDQQNAQRHNKSRNQGAEEFGLPLHFHNRTDDSSTSTGSSTQSSDTEDDSSVSTDLRRRRRSAEKLSGTAALDRLASPTISQHRSQPGPSSLRQSNAPPPSTHHARTLSRGSNNSPTPTQTQTQRPSAPASDTGAGAEKRVTFVEPQESDEPKRISTPLAVSSDLSARSNIRAELQKSREQLGLDRADSSDEDIQDPFPMDDDLSIPADSPEQTKLTSHAAQNEQEQRMFPASDLPTGSPISPASKPIVTPSNPAKWNKLAAQHAEQVAKLRAMLGTDAPSHREADLRALKQARFGGLQTRRAEKQARDLESRHQDALNELDEDEDMGDDRHNGLANEGDLARSLPVNIMKHKPHFSVGYQLKTSLPTHENLLIPEFGIQPQHRTTASAASPSAVPARSMKFDERTIQSQLRQATQGAVSASLSRSSMADTSRSSLKSPPPTEPSPQAAANFRPRKIDNHRRQPPAGPSSLSQSLMSNHVPLELRQRVESREQQQSHAHNAFSAGAIENSSTTDMPEFEGGEPTSFVPPHLWSRM